MRSSPVQQHPPITQQDLAKFRDELISEMKAIVATQVPRSTTSLHRLPEVMRRTGYGRSSIYQKVAAGEFPAPVDLGGGRGIAWREDEITRWINDRDRVASRGKPVTAAAPSAHVRAGGETVPGP